MTDRFLDAQHAHQRGDLVAAEHGYRAVLIETPNHPEAAHFLGLICVTTDRLPEGISYLKQAVAVQPTRGDWWTNLGEALRRQGELEPAVEASRRAVSLSPENADAHFNLGVALRDLEDVEPAMREFRTVLTLRPNSVRAHLQLGQLLRLEGKGPVALQHFQTAVNLKPDSDDGWLGLAATQLELADTAGAWAALERAMALQPNRQEIPRLREDILLKQGRIDDARASFVVSATRSPDEWWQTFRRELLCQVIPPSEEAVEEERKRIQSVIERYRGERLTLPVDQLHHLGIEPPMALTYHGRDERPMKAAFAALCEDLITPLPEVGRSSKDRPKDRSANGTSASDGVAGRIMRSNRWSWLGRMRPDGGGAAELPVHAQGRICLVGADRP